MQLATDVLIYAWIGWAVLMLPTLCVLGATLWVLRKVANRIADKLTQIYRFECIQHYFQKMEKEGTHAFRKDQPPEGQE